MSNRCPCPNAWRSGSSPWVLYQVSVTNKMSSSWIWKRYEVVPTEFVVLNFDSETLAQLSSAGTVLDLQLVALQMDDNTFVSQPSDEQRREANNSLGQSVLRSNPDSPNHRNHADNTLTQWKRPSIWDSVIFGSCVSSSLSEKAPKIKKWVA